MFTIGTGVGGGIVLGGRIYRGATGAAGEMGHTLIGLDLVHGAPSGGKLSAGRVARGACLRTGARRARRRARAPAAAICARP